MNCKALKEVNYNREAASIQYKNKYELIILNEEIIYKRETNEYDARKKIKK